MKILVTGGTGYIGSHTCVALLAEGHDVVIIDNLSNSKIETRDAIEAISGKKVVFYNLDVTNKTELERIFDEHQLDGVIHFAGYKAVGESVEKPIQYYYNNVLSTLNLCELCVKHAVNKFVFSSSATVYGDNVVPFHEDLPLLPTTNPYGETKVMSERILKDVAYANPNLSVSILRYFNPVGAHASGKIGEDPNGIPNNLMPFVTRVAKGAIEKLRIFGDDYSTIDGTGVRDYIHVVDLADGHVAALDHIKRGFNVYNLGTGKGTSVLELVHAFERVNQVKVPYEVGARRPGDIASCYADAWKAEVELKWKAKFGIDEMVRDAWAFEQNNK